eukprot:scaffold288398_cov12-Tisochrysis_lutea.AAC.1
MWPRSQRVMPAFACSMGREKRADEKGKLLTVELSGCQVGFHGQMRLHSNVGQEEHQLKFAWGAYMLEREVAKGGDKKA